jgi:tetratricopeptide (TPR) repeat protein
MSRLEQLRKLARLQPDDPMPHYGLGLEHLNLQQWEDASAAFAQAIAVDPKYSAAYYHKARAEIGASNVGAARETLRVGMETARSVGDWHTESEMRELLGTIE